MGKMLTSQQWEEECVFSGFLGSQEVEVSSWLGRHPLANRLEVVICKGERAKTAQNRNPSSLPILLKVRQGKRVKMNVR